MKYKTFAELLLDKSLLTEDQAKAVRAGVQLRKKDFPAVLYEKFLPEKTVAENYAEFLNVDFIDLETLVIDPVIAKLIPKHIAERHQLVAINKIGLSLVIAMADPAECHSCRRCPADHRIAGKGSNCCTCCDQQGYF